MAKNYSAIKVEQLSTLLKINLSPVYLLSGDEPLQLGEAADEIRMAAKQAGFTNREVINIDKDADWLGVSEAAESLSIFSDKTLIDVRLPGAKVSVEAAKILINYCQTPSEHTILLMTTDKLATTVSKSSWYQAIESLGVIVNVWPLQGKELEFWLQRRSDKRGLHFETDAIKILASRIEGNLLAAVQELEKLYVLYGATTISKAMIESDVVNNSRFDVYQLNDALLAGQLKRSLTILKVLKAEGLAVPVVLWAISREIRLLSQIKSQLHLGVSLERVFKDLHIWGKRKQLLQTALTRHQQVDLLALLALCAETDRQAKGQAAGDSWESLWQICVKFVG